jgi:molybdenum cofactor cytidylyltransferase
LKKIRLNHCAVVLLAAGRSERLGTPKQMLVYEGRTLLQRAAEAALGTGMRPVLVVVGARHAEIEKELEPVKDIRVVLNKKWEEGIASSIRAGVETAMRMDEELEGLIIMVCDQPFVSSELLQALFQKHQETGMPIVASNYEDNPGVPVLFDKKFFSRLLLLKGDTGAKKLLKEQTEQMAIVQFQQGVTDIDTMDDYSKLNKTRREKND